MTDEDEPLMIFGVDCRYIDTEQLRQLEAVLAQWSKSFAEHGDPRTWGPHMVMQDVLDFGWSSGSEKLRIMTAFDEWRRGEWNDWPGVTRPSDTQLDQENG